MDHQLGDLEDDEAMRDKARKQRIWAANNNLKMKMKEDARRTFLTN